MFLLPHIENYKTTFNFHEFRYNHDKNAALENRESFFTGWERWKYQIVGLSFIYKIKIILQGT